MRAQAGGGELIHVSKEIVDRAYGQMQQPRPGGETRGAFAWPGLLRRLVRTDASYRN